MKYAQNLRPWARHQLIKLVNSNKKRKTTKLLQNKKKPTRKKIITKVPEKKNENINIKNNSNKTSKE